MSWQIIHGETWSSYLGVICLLNFYIDKNVNIAKNIALYYAYSPYTFSNWKYLLEQIQYDQKWIEYNYPKLHYTTKYFNCILTQLKKEMFDKLYLKDNNVSKLAHNQ